MNLYRKGSFVPQYTKSWCVAASLQMMRNLERMPDRTRRTQARLFDRALTLSGNPAHGMTTHVGWARTLPELGLGPYEVRSERTRARAVRVAADAMRRTGRPVGLLTWRGAHSWVMHGFTSNADPAATRSFKVTGVFVSDPWYPRVSTIWGPSLPPNAYLTPTQLRVDYLAWAGWNGRTDAFNGQYVLVLPLAERG